MESDDFKSRCYGNGVVDRSACTFRHNPMKERIKLIRLRYHLAAEGCSDSQVSLARSLLEDVECSEHEKAENSELAVRWLFLAAEEGHEEALNLLEKCYHAGVGITSRNRERVEACLKSGDDEKLAFHVGSSIFRMMTYDTQDEVPLHFFVCKVNSLLKNGVMSDVILEDDCNEKVTVKNVIDAVFQCLRCQSPKLQLFQNKQQVYGKSGKMWHAILRLYTLVINYSQQIQEEALNLDISFGILCVLCVIPQESSAYQTWLWCTSFTVILFATSKILQMKKEYMNIVKWQQTVCLVKRDNVFSEPKRPLVKESFLYLLFAAVLLLFIGGFNPLISERILSAALVFSSAMVIVLIRQLRISKLTKLSFLSHAALAGLTYFDLTFTAFSSLHAYLLLKTNFYGVIISVNFLLAFTVLLLLPFSQFTARFDLVLYILSIVWLRILILLFVSSNWLKVSLFLICALLVSKKYNLLLNIAIYLVLEALLMQTGFYAFLFFAAFVVFQYLSKYVLQSFCAKVFLFVILLLPSIFPTDVTNNYVLDWDQYSQVCYKTSHQLGNTARIQDICSQFHNAAIVFEGVVSKIEQQSSENLLESVASALQFSCPLRCIVGETRKKCESKACDLLQHVDECSCHLENWQLTTYRMLVTIKTTFRIIGEVELHLPDTCKNLVYNLQEGDVLLVNGLLKNRLGTNMPQVDLLSAKCLSCVENASCNLTKSSVMVWRPKEFFANVIEFIFGPFVLVEKPV